MIPRVLIIAGADSGGGAGLPADIKSVSALGGHAMTAVTAVTAQNTLGVQAVLPVPAELVIAQARSCLNDLGADAVKIGMLGSAETAHAVADLLDGLGLPIVFDPVMVATSGAALADPATVAAFARLMRMATVVTPNTPELAALAGMDVKDEIEQADAANALMDRTGCPAVLAKGGHLTLSGYSHGTDADGRGWRHDNDTRVFDFLYSQGAQGWQEWNWDSPRLATTSTHGTGCTLASAIAVGLARGRDLPDAIAEARTFVHAALLAAPGLGRGHGPMGQQFAGATCPA